MNANEVIANRACEILGGNKGDKSLIIQMTMLIMVNLAMM